jgi:metal-sulfur cluster biosynthetic enzyme
MDQANESKATGANGPDGQAAGSTSTSSVSSTTAANATATNSDLATLDLENKLREALREVYDPELGMSVIELGLIRKFDWTPDNVDVTMILTTPFCPYGPALIEQVRQKAQESTQRVTRVTMGLEMWDPTMMEDQAAANWGLYY